ncbi:DNA topoisomerase III [Acidilutibacter cellobiosedens]|jgi:DNA topoisomerase-3|uniref:DNA topoisomerase 3 n=1 Tax=Acidilutibacter cellobiosedens TaxID=2507161 RepID=A0A410QGE8_9FIRM|nr:DNA topoisomerase III [Acidilutibacter cellobiosedens]MBE6081146.1 DNA topoisomerase III [Tissierellaceae bacterium]QAT63172.1 DNA topoisomerase III [Acidilutibacter cellobiosedens]
MDKILVLAEKPSVGRDIGRVLKCNRKGNGYLEGNKYIVTWALGHLVTLADPEQYEERYKTWRIDDLPILPSQMKLVVIKQSSKQFHIVKEQMNRKDVSQIIIATDAGREGELVARWIIEKVHSHKPLKRLWISSVTDKAIKEGFDKLRDGREYENLYRAAVARAESDWIVGINATRALTCKYNAQLSCGRVQTPTLAMVAKREEEIKKFKSQDFYGIAALAKNIKLIWQDSKTKDMRIFDKKRCDEIISNIRGKDGIVADVEKANKKSFSPKLYDLTELQRDANRIFGYSAKETLGIMQRLYENHKILTYPRTDSKYITTDIVDTLKERIEACGVGIYKQSAAKALKNPINPNKNFVDNSKVSDHHAIIPTEQKVILSELNEKEKKIYDLVVKRFLSVLYPPFEYEQTTIRAKIGEENFIAKGKRVIAQGWKEVYSNNYEEDDSNEDIPQQILPRINKGDVLKISSIVQTKGQTKPPSPFNEGTLLSAMENPAKYMAGESKDLIKIIGETGGIGTVATRADIIEKLFNTFLIEKKGKEIFITSKGKQLLGLVPDDLKSPALTAQWEQKLEAISKGKIDDNSFVKEMKDYSKSIVSDIKNSSETFKHDNMTRIKCPQCGKFMLEVKGKKGRMLICQDRDCGYRKNVSRITNARCPNCHKKMELQGEGDNQIFVCGCGYREKLSAFDNRRKNEKNTVSKKEVANYLREQKNSKKEPINTELADALKGLKLK